MADIATIVSTVGFPICSFLMSAYFIKYCYDKQLEQDEKHDAQQEKHWEEISKLTEAVNANSIAIKELVQQLNKGV